MMGDIIIVALVVVALIFAFRRAFGHTKGDCGCGCGGNCKNKKK